MLEKATLECIEIDPAGPVRRSVIWLHGLGADGHDFEPLVPELRLPDEAGFRFVLPHAPERPVTINNGMVMRAWYDVRAADLSRGEDAAGIRQSADALLDLVRREHARGIAWEHIILAGFSQGGAIALFTALRCGNRLGGVLALSTYIPLAEQLVREADASNADLPVFMAHGTADPVIPLGLAERGAGWLEQAGHPVEMHRYPMGHGVCLEEVTAIRGWLLGLCHDPD